MLDAREIWLEWTVAGDRRRVERADLCEVEETDSDDPWVCELPAAHPGGHSFELECGGARALTPQREKQMVEAAFRTLAKEEAPAGHLSAGGMDGRGSRC